MTDPQTAWVTVTPDLAAEWLDVNDANRHMRARVVSAYERDMSGGLWLVTGETIKFARTGELLDGQHRLAAIMASGIPQRLLVVQDLDAAARTVIDAGAPRTGADALRMAGVVSHNSNALAAAARLRVLWDSGRLTHYSGGMRHDDRATHGELLDVVTRRPNLIDATNDAHTDYPRIGLPTGPQAFARDVLYDIDAEDAAVFWQALAGYSTDGNNDPRAVLLFTVRQMRALGQLRKPGEAVGITFAAWNAWRDKQRITSLPTRDAKGRPLRIPQPV